MPRAQKDLEHKIADEGEALTVRTARLKAAILQARDKKQSAGLEEVVGNLFTLGYNLFGGDVDDYITRHISPKIVYGRRTAVRELAWNLYFLGRTTRKYVERTRAQ